MNNLAKWVPALREEDQTPAAYFQMRLVEGGVSEDLQREVVRTQACGWAKDVLKQGNLPTLAGFWNFYPEWADEKFIDLIEAVLMAETELAQ